MNVLDLFSGIGGFSLGLERAGFRTVAFCEVDPYCRAVIARHWPGVPILGDIREVTAATVADATRDVCAEPAARGAERERTRPSGQPVDVICGGFPCQDISVAGKGAGLAGARSGLWSEYHRLIGGLRPRYVIVENVSALLARGLERVLGDLAAIGYDAEWHCIPAAYVGAPHRRDRIWIVAYPDGGRELQPERRISQERGLSGDSSKVMAHADEPRPQGRDRPELPERPSKRSAGSRGASVADASGSGCGQRDSDASRSGARNRAAWFRGSGLAECGWWESEPDVRGMVDGATSRLDGDLNGSHRMDTLARASCLPEDILRTVWWELSARAASQGSQSDEQLAQELTDRVPELSYALALGRGQESLAAASRFLHRLRQACEALGAVRDASQPTVEAWLTLFHEEAERAFLAAYGRADWSSGEWLGVGRVAHKVPSRVDRLRALGNAVVPQVVEVIGRAIMEHAHG